MSAKQPRVLRLRVAPGLEELALADLRARGLKGEVEPGGVLFPLEALHEVLLWSRMGTAVTRRMGTVRPEKLPDGLVSLPWRRVLRRSQRVDVRLVGFNARGLEKKVAAVVGRLSDPSATRHRAGDVRILLVKRSGRVEVVLEAARELFKRGWRKRPGRAPIRENLAAGLLTVAKWRPDEVLVDPMCGSGTFPIEAVSIGLGRAPGAWRSFACEAWPEFDAKAFAKRRQKARDAGQGQVRIYASDRSPRQLEDAKANAKSARAERHIRFENVAFEELEVPEERGLVIMNPPYGQRLAATESTYHFIGSVLADRWAGWRYGILLPDPKWVRCLPGRPRVSTMVQTGGRKVWFAVGETY